MDACPRALPASPHRGNTTPKTPQGRLPWASTRLLPSRPSSAPATLVRLCEIGPSAPPLSKPSLSLPGTKRAAGPLQRAVRDPALRVLQQTTPNHCSAPAARSGRVRIPYLRIPRADAPFGCNAPPRRLYLPYQRAFGQRRGRASFWICRVRILRFSHKAVLCHPGCHSDPFGPCCTGHCPGATVI